MELPDGGGRIMLCTEGSAVVECGGERMRLQRGQSLWLPAADRGVTVAPDNTPTQLFLATDGLTDTDACALTARITGDTVRRWTK